MPTPLPRVSTGSATACSPIRRARGTACAPNDRCALYHREYRLKARQDERQASADRRILELAKQAADAEERLTRLCGAIETGTVDGTNPTLRERVAALKGAREKSIEALDYAKRSGLVPIEIDPVVIERFTRLMREKLVSGVPRAGRLISAQSSTRSLSHRTRSGSPAKTTISGQRWTRTANRPPPVRKSVQEWCPIHPRTCSLDSPAICARASWATWARWIAQPASVTPRATSIIEFRMFSGPPDRSRSFRNREAKGSHTSCYAAIMVSASAVQRSRSAAGVPAGLGSAPRCAAGGGCNTVPRCRARNTAASSFQTGVSGGCLRDS